MVEYPRTVDALVNSTAWMGKIRTAVSRFDINEDTEDLVADVICQMLSRTKDGENYIERWQPGLGSYSNWIYTFVNNICRKKYNRLHSKTGQALRYAGSLVEEPEDGEVLKKGEVPVSMLPKTTHRVEAEYKLLTEEILSQLKAVPAYSWVVYNHAGYVIADQAGEEKKVHYTESQLEDENFMAEAEVHANKKYDRDLATTFELLSKGHEPKEIAQLFQTSVTFIYSLIRKMRAVDIVQDWYEAELGQAPQRC